MQETTDNGAMPFRLRNPLPPLRAGRTAVGLYGRLGVVQVVGTVSSKAVPADLYASILALTWAGVRTWSLTWST